MSQGQPGKVGAPGKIGVPGKIGAPGQPGKVGAPGKIGAPGQPGKIGLPGQTGKPGVSDTPGPKGSPGVTGAKGDTGLVGATGIQGPSGIHTKEISRFLYPSTIHYNKSVDKLRRLNMSSYNTFSENGWIFNEGVLKFQVKKYTKFDDIKNIMINFYTINESTFKLNVKFDNSDITYSHDTLISGKKYQATTDDEDEYDYQYDEKIYLVKENVDNYGDVKEIDIEMISGNLIISSLIIVYKDVTMNHFLMN